jgi:hypothetical protein
MPLSAKVTATISSARAEGSARMTAVAINAAPSRAHLWMPVDLFMCVLLAVNQQIPFTHLSR